MMALVGYRLVFSASMDSRLVGAAEKYAYKEEASMTIKPNLSNVNLSASLIWHY